MTDTKPLLHWFIRLGIGIAILYYLFTFISFSEVVSAISSVRAPWVASAFVVLILERYVAAIRLKILTDRLDMSLPVLVIWEINTISSFYGMFLPGDLAGGAVRWYRISHPQGRRAEAFAAIIFERLIDTIALLGFGMMFWFWDVPPIGSVTVNLVFVAIFGGLLLGMSLSLSHKTSAVLQRMTGLVPGVALRRLLAEKFEKVLVAVREFRKLSRQALACLIGLTCARHLLSVLILFCFAGALEMSISFASIGWLRSLLNLITMLPVSFSGLGIREGGLVILLEPYGVPGSQAVALSFLIFVTYLVMGVTGGLLEVKNMLLARRRSERAT